jgi:hypothetical protein
MENDFLSMKYEICSSMYALNYCSICDVNIICHLFLAGEILADKFFIPSTNSHVKCFSSCARYSKLVAENNKKQQHM